MSFEKAYICSWDHLCRLYSSTGQISKLKLFIPKIEDFINSLRSPLSRLGYAKNSP